MDLPLLTGLDLQLLVTLFLFLLFRTLHVQVARRDFYGWWMWGWGSFALFLVLWRVPALLGADPEVHASLQFLAVPLALLQVPLFYLGARSLHGKPPGRRFWKLLLVGTGLVGVALAALVVGAAGDPEMARAYRGVIRQFGLAVVFPYCAYVVYRHEAQGHSAVPNGIMAVGFLAWGVNQLVYGIGSTGLLLGVVHPVEDYILSSWSYLADILAEGAIGLGATLLILSEAGEIRRALTRTEDRFRYILDHAGDAMFLHDRDGWITEVNREACESLGYDREELLEMNVSDIVANEKALEQGKQMEPGDHVTVEGVHRRKDGTTFPVQVRVSLIVVDGETTVLAVARDVTEQKRQEEALRQAKRAAEAADRAKSEFLATMSHEIRTPMNAIIGMAELLEDTTLTPEQRDYVQVFRTAGDTLLNLINEVLDLAKIEAGRLELEERGFDPRELAEHVVQMFAVQAHRKGLEIAARVAPGIPGWVVGDPDRLRQVLVNLLGNAVKFTEQGEVVLELSPGAEDAEGQRAEILFSVRDTGVGIPEEKLGAIFERFTQADSSTTRRFGGTGLGLTISQSIVDLMGGSVAVESQEGEGTRFHFNAWFRTDQAPEDLESASPEDIRGLRALVVDDNATNRLILAEMLALWGLRSAEATDGASGLAKLREAREAGRPFHVLLLDGHMPGMSGFDVATVVQDDPGLADTMVMMLTSADSYPNEVEQARRLGVARYMVKPIRRARLLEALRETLGTFRGRGEEPAPAAAEETPEQGLRLLLVEDHPDNRMLIERYLAKTPHDVVTAENGQEAVDEFTAAPGAFDLVLMDMQMPVMDGYEATRRIREWEKANAAGHTPILALTAHALAAEKEKSAQAGCDAHLTKPIKKRALLDALDAHAPGAPTPTGADE